jgi:hypothetical protein
VTRSASAYAGVVYYSKAHLCCLLLSALFLPEAIRADSYRCGLKLVQTGDTKAELVRVCGKPLRKDTGTERVRIEGRYADVSVQRWYYKQSRRSLERIVLLHRGMIVGIETGSR